MKKIICSAAILLFCFSDAFALETTFTPRLTLRGEYTDNIDRTPDDEEEDYISSISPGASLGLRGATAGITLSYAPAYVQYKEHSERDQWRHYASLRGDWRPARRSDFNLMHSLTISDDPADDEGTATVVRPRNRYMRNDGTISFTHQFGREDSIAVGYRQSNLDNEEDFVEDSQRMNPYLDLTWWFIENRYGITLYTDYTKGDFQRSDDFDSYSGNLRLRRRFSRNLDMFFQYAHVETQYEGFSEDYKVYNPAIGFNYISGEQTNISLALGYIIREREYSENDESPIVTGDLTTAWIYSRGSINLHMDSGYSQDSFSTESRGFYFYSGANISAGYGFTRAITGDLFGGYRYVKYLDDDPNTEDQVITGGAGLGYQALSWLKFRLEYAHRNFISNIDSREYKENRGTFIIILEPSTPYRLN